MGRCMVYKGVEQELTGSDKILVEELRLRT